MYVYVGVGFRRRINKDEPEVPCYIPVTIHSVVCTQQETADYLSDQSAGWTVPPNQQAPLRWCVLWIYDIVGSVAGIRYTMRYTDKCCVCVCVDYTATYALLVFTPATHSEDLALHATRAIYLTLSVRLLSFSSIATPHVHLLFFYRF